MNRLSGSERQAAADALADRLLVREVPLVAIGNRAQRARSVAGIGAAFVTLAIAAPIATADPAPLFIPRSQHEQPRHGEGLSGADRAWLSLRQTTPRLGEGLTGADRNWLTPSSSGGRIATPATGFDWGDAGIGAGATAAVLLVVTGTGVAIRRRLSTAH